MTNAETGDTAEKEEGRSGGKSKRNRRKSGGSSNGGKDKGKKGEGRMTDHKRLRRQRSEDAGRQREERNSGL